MNFEKWMQRAAALVDGSAWLLMVPCLLVWYFFDPLGMQVVVLWLTHLPVVVGVTIILSRIVFPDIKLSELIADVRGGNVAAAVVVARLLVFVGLLVLTAAGWAK
ncbi:hypothetical protein [Collimonas fungivorans]|uniref:hypothetical protein n=1 Tax=Collimonas fungivorans TaxID=158899 RepID=UPI003FA3A544